MKKIIALLLALVLAVSCFVACEQKPVETQPKDDPKPTDSKPVETDPVETEPENLFDGKHDIVEVTWCVRHNPEEDLEQVLDYLNKTYLEPRYNLHLNVIMTSNSEYNDKMTMMMTGGEDWDICYTASFVNNYWDRVAMGAYYELDQLFDTAEWKELEAALPEGLLDWAKVDGKYYGIPNYQIMSSPSALFVRKDLLDKYNIKIEDDSVVGDIYEHAGLMKLLDEVNENEPTVIPMAFVGQAYGTVAWNGESEFRNVGSYDYASYYKDTTDYKVFWADQDPAYQEYYLDMWEDRIEFAKKGYFQDDYLTATNTQDLLKQNAFAIYASTGKPGGGADMTARYGTEYIQIYCSNKEYYQGSPMTTCTSINYNSKNPLAALKMISVMWNDLDVYNTFLAGIPDEHYKKISDTRIEPIADSGYNMVGWGWGCGNQFNQWLIPGQADDVWEETKAMNENGMIDTTNGFTVNREPYQTEYGNLQTLAKEWTNWQWYCKDRAELEAKYKEYLEAQKECGIEKVIEEVGKQLQDWAKANGKL